MSLVTPLRRRLRSRLRASALAAPALLLAGCNTVVMNPSGDVAVQQAHLIVVSTVLMLLIIVPVIVMTLLFAWRYRASNTQAAYHPDWDHSIQLELIIWAAPLLIIIALGAVTWISTHTLDPYRPLRQVAPGRAVSALTPPLSVEVVALDWKWLFIYPDQGVAVVNELAAPVDTPIDFKITASSVMNSFYVPALAGQIYAMPGMQTQLHAVINHTGDFEGFSANYSGAGFSGMHFKFRGMSRADFDRWIQSTRDAGGRLESANYMQLAQPSIGDGVRRYGALAPDLYDTILRQCAAPGAVCVDATMPHD